LANAPFLYRIWQFAMYIVKKWWIFVSVACCLALLVAGLNTIFSRGDALTTKISSAPSFGLPIDCKLGQNCYVMHYVDRDPSKEIVDFGCGRQTYDGHSGTDFGIANLYQMAVGVPVIAVTDGKVLRVRDGVADRLITNQVDKETVQGTECGNGLVIDHGNGWSTQYCHLRQGSVVVKPGSPVQKGTVLGMVGSSGLASFPHVHLTVRYQNKVIDPFVGTNDRKSCSIARNPLWSMPLSYVPTGLVSAGFAAQPPTQLELWQGKYRESTLATNNSPALVFWVHSYGVLAGDTEKLQLINPQGEVVINQQKAISRSARSFVSYGGKRQLVAGKWHGKYQLFRNNQAMVQVDREVIVQ
jgi:murein DD-endopeptidase